MQALEQRRSSCRVEQSILGQPPGQAEFRDGSVITVKGESVSVGEKKGSKKGQQLFPVEEFMGVLFFFSGLVFL